MILFRGMSQSSVWSLIQFKLVLFQAAVSPLLISDDRHEYLNCCSWSICSSTVGAALSINSSQPDVCSYFCLPCSQLETFVSSGDVLQLEVRVPRDLRGAGDRSIVALRRRTGMGSAGAVLRRSVDPCQPPPCLRKSTSFFASLCSDQLSPNLDVRERQPAKTMLTQPCKYWNYI